MPDSIFAKIVAGELPAEIVYQDDRHLAFLSIMPHNPGHTIVIPKQTDTGNFWEMEPSALAELVTCAQTVSRVLLSELKPKRIGLVFEGFGVEDYVHINLVPINQPGDLDHGAAHAVSPAELAKVADRLRTAFEANIDGSSTAKNKENPT